MKLTEADIKTISIALSDAIEWRDGLADAHHRTGPEAALAKATAERYERLHRKLTGLPTAFHTRAESDRHAKRISIFELGEDK